MKAYKELFENFNIPPETWDATAFRQGMALIAKHFEKLNKPTAIIVRLAMVAGGKTLAAAMDTKSFPPCLTKGKNCNGCWVREWCIHKNTTPDDEVMLHHALLFLADLKNISDADLKRLLSLDKTKTEDIEAMICMLTKLQYQQDNEDLDLLEIGDDEDTDQT